MDAAQIKAFRIKYKSLDRTYKQYKAYKTEFEAYDINEVSQSKKKTQFYEESKLALEQVQKNLIEFCQQLNSYMDQHKEQINQEETIKQEAQKAQAQLAEVKGLFPAAF